MSRRFQAKEGLYNIECAFCGCKVKNNQTHLTKETKQAICNWHPFDENYERPGPIVPVEAQPVRPQKIPTETYDDVEIPGNASSLEDLVPDNSNG